MYLTVSFWILMFSCARRTARSKMLRCCCCCRCSRSLFGFCRAFCCAHQAAANAAPVAAALKMCSYALSKLILSLPLSRSRSPPMYTISMCERARASAYVCMCLCVGFTCTRTFLQQYACACVRACVLSSIYFHLCGKEMQSKRALCDVISTKLSPMHISFAPERIINLLFVSVVKNALLFLRFQFDDVRLVGLRSLLLLFLFL